MYHDARRFARIAGMPDRAAGVSHEGQRAGKKPVKPEKPENRIYFYTVQQNSALVYLRRFQL